MNGQADRPVVATGAMRTIEAAVCLDGNSPAQEFLDQLAEADQQKLAALFARMADHGVVTNEEKFKKLEGAIWEFKSSQIRIPCFQDGRAWVLTHGFLKKKQKAPKREIERAERIMHEDQQRQARRRARRNSHGSDIR
jgi:phage-related protein